MYVCVYDPVCETATVVYNSLTGDLSELSVLFRKIARLSVAASENLPTPFVPQLESIRKTSSVNTAHA